jgi:hypothetical protein
MLARPPERSMKVDKGRILLAIALIIFVFSLLALLFWDFVRDTIVVPIYRFLWVSGLILKSIPQGAYLAALIVASIVIGLHTLRVMTLSRIGQRFADNSPQTDNSRYVYWKRLCANVYTSPFSQGQFSSEARKLTLAILAYQEGIEASEAEMRVSNGTLTVPNPIRNLIQRLPIQDSKPTSKRTPNPVLRVRRMLLREDPLRDPRIDNQLAEIISFIEQRLEINRAGNQPNGSS